MEGGADKGLREMLVGGEVREEEGVELVGSGVLLERGELFGGAVADGVELEEALDAGDTLVDVFPEMLVIRVVDDLKHLRKVQITLPISIRDILLIVTIQLNNHLHILPKLRQTPDPAHRLLPQLTT